MIRVVIVDDHAVLREGIALLIRSQPDMVLVGECSHGSEALTLLEAESVDVLVTDQRMPGMDGLTLTAAVRARHPDTRIVVLTMHDERYLYREMKEAGVDGYVLKKDPSSELTTAIREVFAGREFVSPAVASVMQTGSESDESPLLSTREMEILRLVVQELSNAEIADRLFISQLTVATHRKNIFRKTGASSLVGLINFAHENGLVA